jgi:PP-loop superfamily ATP-utilizing enzyme
MQDIVSEFKNNGYCYATLDLKGYKKGSMNKLLKDKN